MQWGRSEEGRERAWRVSNKVSNKEDREEEMAARGGGGQISAEVACGRFGVDSGCRGGIWVKKSQTDRRSRVAAGSSG